MRTRGFTLLEVSVALAVLAIGLVAVVDINTGAARLHEQSQHLTLGTLLAKSKMIDLEQKLNEDGFSDFDKQIDGTFEEQSHPEIRWHAEILKPDVTKASDQITQLVTGAMSGGGGATGGLAGGGLSSLLSGNSLTPPGSLPSGLSLPTPSSADSNSPTTTGLGGALGQATTGLIQMQVQQLVALIQSGVREVRLTVTWPDGAREDTLSVSTHFVILQATGTGVGSGTPAGQGTPQGAGAGGLPGGLGSAGIQSLGGGGLNLGGSTAPNGVLGGSSPGVH